MGFMNLPKFLGKESQWISIVKHGDIILFLWAQTMEIDKSETQKISEIINNNILPYQITK